MEPRPFGGAEPAWEGATVGLIKNLKKLKLKKIKPGVLLQKGIHAAAVAGIPGAGTADRLSQAVGKRVDDAKRAAEKIKAEIERVKKESGLSTLEATDRVAQRAIAGAEGALAATTPQGQAIIALIVVAVVLFFLTRGK